MAEAIKAGLTLIAGGLQVHQRLAQQNAEARTAPTPQSVKTREPTDEELQQFVSELSDEELAELGLDEEELDAEPADEPNEEPVADFETFRSAKIEQRRQAESPSYGSGAFEESVDDKGHVAIRPTIRRDSFADLLDYTKFKKAEEAAKAAKAAKIEAARSAGRVRDFFTRTKVETGTKPEAQQPASQQTSVWSWLYRRVATPRQSIWK